MLKGSRGRGYNFVGDRGYYYPLAIKNTTESKMEQAKGPKTMLKELIHFVVSRRNIVFEYLRYLVIIFAAQAVYDLYPHFWVAFISGWSLAILNNILKDARQRKLARQQRIEFVRTTLDNYWKGWDQE